MSDRIPVFVYADDPISQVGLSSQLRPRPEVWVVDADDLDRAVVAVVVAEEVDEVAVRTMRALQRNGCPQVLVVVTHLDDAGLFRAVEVGVAGVLRRSEAQPERLVAAIVAAVSGQRTLAPDLLGRLMTQVGELGRQVLAPRGLGLSGLSEREIEVLRLLSEGCDTAEVARKLLYSERTVKNVIHDLTTRLQLKNRSHAVAYAVRHGLI